MKTQTYIEVNGKKYDARTGKLINSAPHYAVKHSLDGVNRVSSHIVKPTVHKLRKVQKSQTLMRAAVKKPEVKRAPTTEEAHRAASNLISKFGSRVEPVKPRLEPVMLAHSKEEIAKLHEQTSRLADTVGRSISKSESLVSRAIESATSHNQHKHKLKKHHRVAERLGISKKTARVGSALVAVLVLGAFFAYQSVPNFAMRVAATRAGFDAKMPDYHPSGFGFRGPVHYRSGEVIVNFGSNTGDGREFALTQRASNWNNDALLANFVLSTDSQYQQFQENNKTIYIYDRSNATWVDDGVWYQLEGNADLTTDQISRLANSL